MVYSDDNIRLIYNWYCRAMRAAGYRVSPPKNTEFTKTYQFRAISKFAKRMEELELSEESVKALIGSVVRYGKQHKLLTTKCTSILNMQAIVEICMKDLRNREQAVSDVMESIRKAHAYLVNNGINSTDALVRPPALGGLPRLQLLLKSGALPASYLAVSRTAANALEQIDRDSLPSDQTLLRIRARLYLNADTRHELHSILGRDLNTAGMPRSIA